MWRMKTVLLSQDLPKHPSVSEPFKAGVHLALFGLVVAAGLYNLSESMRRPKEKHLRLNVLTYVVMTFYEVFQITKHLKEM